MHAPLTPRERLRLTLAHRQPDRPPIQVSMTPEVRQGLEDHLEKRLGYRDVARAFDTDFRHVGPRPRTRGAPTPQSRTCLTEGFYQDTHSRPLAAIRTLDDVAVYTPARTPEGFDFSVVAEQCRLWHDQGFVTVFGNAGIFDIVNGLGSRGRGYEQLICEIMYQDEVAVALVDKHLRAEYEYCKRGLDAGGGEIDVLDIGEDCGTQNGPLFAPDRFRGFFAPRMKRFADLAHSHGAACMLHSCPALTGA